jgi:serine/threonine-protein kinase
VILGSPEYMSPEQARGGGDVDHRADVWGVAVCLYEAINGQRPFDDESLDALLLQVLTRNPSRPEGVDDSLWQILQRALDKNRDHRFQFTSDFGEALAQWLVYNGIEVDASGRSVRSRWLGESSIADQSQPIRAVTVNSAGGTGLPPQVEVIVEKRRKTSLFIGAAIALVAAMVLAGVFLVTRDPAPAARRESSKEMSPTIDDKRPEADTPSRETAKVVAPEAPAPRAPTTSSSPEPSAESTNQPQSPPKPPAWRPRPSPQAKPASSFPLPDDADF